MCRIDVRCKHGNSAGAGGLLVAAVALVVAAGMALSVLGSVLTAVAALVSTLMWVLPTTAGVGVLAWAGLALTREVLAYRADRQDARWVLAQLAARGIPISPPAESLRPGSDRVSVTSAAWPTPVAGRGGA